MDMARSKIQEVIFSIYEAGEVLNIKSLLESQIKNIAKSGLVDQISDIDTRQKVLSTIDASSFDHLFATVH